MTCDYRHDQMSHHGHLHVMHAHLRQLCGAPHHGPYRQIRVHHVRNDFRDCHYHRRRPLLHHHNPLPRRHHHRIRRRIHLHNHCHHPLHHRNRHHHPHHDRLNYDNFHCRHRHHRNCRHHRTDLHHHRTDLHHHRTDLHRIPGCYCGLNLIFRPCLRCCGVRPCP